MTGFVSALCRISSGKATAVSVQETLSIKLRDYRRIHILTHQHIQVTQEPACSSINYKYTHILVKPSTAIRETHDLFNAVLHNMVVWYV